ncbi:MAG: tRNA (guanosine(46)-N7)-methyltransferase TrmB [Balneolaceae bacterium]|nr:MAG: tRNA (guanosine(46)-N7)-methyltransferase TrmB [Balneolaceae bacterium]
MGKKNKTGRIAEVNQFPHVIQYVDFEDEHELKGKWASEEFNHENPITLELACGKGEYSVNLAKKFPGRNFIGVDIKGPRIWVGAKEAVEQNITNVRFLRAFIDHLENYFSKGEVEEIWIPFSDPYLKKPKKRLTSPKFLNIYRKVLKPWGTIHLKTDSKVLYNYTLDVIKREDLNVITRIDDVYRDAPEHELLTSIQTYYEKMHLKEGKTIHYVAFQLTP